MTNYVAGQPRIVCAALKGVQEPVEGDIIIGIRHNDALMREQKMASGREAWVGAIQGFIDQYYYFHTREEAWVIAMEAGQIIRRCGGDEGRLFSENLY